MAAIIAEDRLLEKYAMAIAQHKSWRELCSAALQATDPDELLKIVEQLSKALKREEQVRRDFRAATSLNKAPAAIRP
jgi:hypothetical protein